MCAADVKASVVEHDARGMTARAASVARAAVVLAAAALVVPVCMAAGCSSVGSIEKKCVGEVRYFLMRWLFFDAITVFFKNV